MNDAIAHFIFSEHSISNLGVFVFIYWSFWLGRKFEKGKRVHNHPLDHQARASHQEEKAEVIKLWNGFVKKVEPFRGDEEHAQDLAEFYLERGDDIIYYYEEG